MYGMLVEENTKMFSLSFSFSFSRKESTDRSAFFSIR